MKDGIRIAHIMHDSIPLLSGYSIRGKYIVENQKKDGLYPFVISSPAQISKDFCEKINDIDYFRFQPNKMNLLTKKVLLKIPFFWRYPFRESFRKHCISVLSQENCNVVHAHEVFNISQVAWDVSKIFKKKLVYELRGLVEDSDVVNKKLKQHSLKYKFDRWEKTTVMKKADAVVAISDNLKKDLIERGIKEDKIFVVPNGVDTEVFYPVPKDTDLIRKYNLEKSIVLGYIGSIRKLEGLDLVIKSFSKILRINADIKLIIVGDGPEKASLLEFAQKNGLLKSIIFTNKISHNDILKYYSILDIVVIPRIKARVNEVVTPLKPLEAMATEKCLLVSDVGGLTELIKNNETGISFNADNQNDFINKLSVLIRNQESRLNIGKNARKWVCAERTWNRVTKTYQNIYNYVLEGSKCN